MKKFSNKMLSILLSILMIVSVLPAGMVTAQAAEQWLWPVAARHWMNGGYYSYQFESGGAMHWHGGVDIGDDSLYGTPIRATMSGTVVISHSGDIGGKYYGGGNFVVIKHSNGYYSHYNHLSSRSVSAGDYVKQGQEIGKMGNSGNAYGTHLHFAIATSDDGISGRIVADPGSINYIYESNYKPDIPAATTPSLRVNNADVAVGKNVTFSWSSSNASKYEYVLTSPSGRTTTETITDSSKAVNLNEVGKYTFKVKAFNSENKGTSYSNTVTCTTHAKVNVQFVDWDDSPLTNKMTVDWNSDVQEPVAPSRKGYTFQNWDKSSKKITEDRIIKAQYKINTYTVKFYDKAGKLLKSEKVDYDHDATPPENTNAPTGYVFQGWNSEEYKNVYTESSTRTIDIYGIYAWFNDDLPVVCEITSAKRQDDGYYVYFDLTNYDKGITRGRAVVSLKTAEGKLVDTTESTAFSIPVNGTKKGIEVFVPCDYSASKAEVIIVDSYSSGVPISENVSTVIDQGLAWTDWSPEKPDENNEYLETETGTQYRYSDKQFTTSTSTNAMTGWTLYNTTKSWSDYGSWSGWSISGASSSSSRQVETRATYRYHAFASSCCRDPYSGNCDHGRACSWTEMYYPTKGTSLGGNTTSYCTSKKYVYINGTKWWYELDGTNNQYNGYGQPARTEYRYRDRKEITTHHFYKWGDWSDWTNEAISATDNKKVETRTVYRYKDNSAVENNSGVVRTAKGKLDESFAGKQITLYVYGYIGASDFTNYYIGQSVIAEDGSYSFTYKLREEPTEITGDYTVAIGIEGTTNTTVIDKIEAPKPKYTVNFYDWDGTIVSTQTVTQGQDAVLPADPTREGYDFKGWDKSITNVQEDMDIFSDFAKKEYEVIFVDWANKSISVQKYEHGDKLNVPDTFAVKGFTFEGWDRENVENTIVTSNMVVSAEYCITKYTVKFLDFDGKVIETQQVEYGSEAKAPTSVQTSSDGKQFAGWFNPDEYQYVENDVVISPAYYFEETTDTPVANYETGEYENALELTLTSKDKNAVIFYYLNGDQSTEKIYTKPITVDKTSSVTYYATSFGKNNSQIATNYYCINSAGKPSAWMLYSQVPQEVKDNISEYNLESEIGYRFKNVQSASTPSEVENLINDGWTFESKAYSSYTNWQDAPIAVDESKLGFEIDTQEVADTTKTRYQYSHYKYVDNGVTKYSNKAVDGFDCEYETTISDTRLSIAGFTDDNITYYVANGEQWFNQTRVSGVKTQYRSRYQIVTYYKWTDWDVVDLSSNETREYEEDDLFRYSNVNYHLVDIVKIGVDIDSKVLIVKDDALINLEDIAITGYNFDGLYLDADFTEGFDENTPITESLTLYPKYTPKTYTVSFQMLDGTEIDFQEVEYMNSAVAPDADAVPGFVFGGWEDKFDCVTEDMVIYGRYYKESEYARISLDKNEVKMYQGTSIVLEPTIYPAALSDSEIEWSVSDSSVANVNDKGVVTAVGTGTVEVKATVVSTRESASCTIKIEGSTIFAILLSEDSNLNYDSLGYLRRIKDNTAVSSIASQFQNKNLEFVDINGSILSQNGKVGTGTKINLYGKGELIDSKTAIITGDMTGDGIINNRDVVMFNKYQVRKVVPEECQILAMDVNGDGYVNNRDAAMLARYLVGKETLK